MEQDSIKRHYTPRLWCCQTNLPESCREGLLLRLRHSERPKGAQRLKGVEESLQSHSCHCKRRFLDSLRSLLRNLAC